jgi:hypothetical protein
MPRKITLTVAEAESEIDRIAVLIDLCKDTPTRNRYTARRSRLLRHVVVHTSLNKTGRQALLIVHLRSQVHILRAMVLQTGVNINSLDRATDLGATGVGDLGMQQAWLDEIATEPFESMTYKDVLTSGVSTEPGGEIDFLDDLIGVSSTGDMSNDIEKLMEDEELMEELMGGGKLVDDDIEHNEHDMFDGPM